MSSRPAGGSGRHRGRVRDGRAGGVGGTQRPSPHRRGTAARRGPIAACRPTRRGGQRRRAGARSTLPDASVSGSIGEAGGDRRNDDGGGDDVGQRQHELAADGGVDGKVGHERQGGERNCHYRERAPRAANPAPEQLGDPDADSGAYEGELGEAEERDLLAVDGEGDVGGAGDGDDDHRDDSGDEAGDDAGAPHGAAGRGNVGDGGGAERGDHGGGHGGAPVCL